MSSILSQRVYSTSSLVQSANSSELWCIKQASVANVHFEVYQNVTLTIKTCSDSDKHSAARCTLGVMTRKYGIGASLRDGVSHRQLCPWMSSRPNAAADLTENKGLLHRKEDQIGPFASRRLKGRTAWWDTIEDDVQTVLKSPYDSEIVNNMYSVAKIIRADPSTQTAIPYGFYFVCWPADGEHYGWKKQLYSRLGVSNIWAVGWMCEVEKVL